MKWLENMTTMFFFSKITKINIEKHRIRRNLPNVENIENIECLETSISVHSTRKRRRAHSSKGQIRIEITHPHETDRSHILRTSSHALMTTNTFIEYIYREMTLKSYNFIDKNRGPVLGPEPRPRTKQSVFYGRCVSKHGTHDCALEICRRDLLLFRVAMRS